MEANGDGSFESLLAQLRRTSNQESQPQAPQHQHQQPPQHQNQASDLIAQFNNYHQAQQPPYYGGQQSQGTPQYPDSPFNPALAAPGIMASHVPAAPSPPTGDFPNAQFPPGMVFGHGAHPEHRHTIFSPQPSSAHGRDDPDHQHTIYALQSYSHSHDDGAARNTERHGNLLSLLKFSGSNQNQENESLQHAPQPPSRDEPVRDLIHAPAPAPSDPTGLLAALMSGSVKEDHPPESPVQPAPAAQSWNSTAQSAESKQYLLNLLNRPKPSQSDNTYPDAAKSQTQSPRSISGLTHEPVKEFTSLQDGVSGTQEKTEHRSHLAFESPKPQAAAAATIFGGYSNPFEELAASSPLNRNKGSAAASTTSHSHGALTPNQSNNHIQILKKPAASPGSQQSHVSTPERSRRKRDTGVGSPEPLVITVSPKPEKAKETVSEAVHDLADKVDNEAKLALARAEHEKSQAEIAKDLDEMLHAKTEKEFEESAHAAAQAIERVLQREGGNPLVQGGLPEDVAKAVQDIVDEAAHGPVADSWESAEADEIVVVEDEETESPVKVYNLPMKPWISISVQNLNTDSRPIFRDESILDIARLKKDFDQVDRNLVTATESYMAYGMSKQGGLRVIRQMDGKDAKLFTDTKDRIFNLSISSTPSDQQDTLHEEAIIGTGISGTVYWVQVKSGEKDYLEDAHPEQYGFALPPITAQEGDAPGGVLKTRARTSTNHPEYFAVGRGKSINIVWPGFVMKHGLFKSDRVVDTERLAAECSLKINTGKAGKDFTFSQDDTTIISLDKSGRVKFWDVRDLTAAKGKEGSDYRLPAQTSLEIKEPLMTLTTTPEGEKAWPTSVLLLDKLRPYQKRGALRYMIVGMKQNHTLQLWDLALGKPVQEFNLPHSKESDAVCSVMYHPPTGMIVVGHPTRNSVYFLHLSAPKYTMRTTISQVEYIQKLTAQDPSIPLPESTAVISGLREYSFGNRGILRSLDILQNPTSSGDDQALFELYGMHSKGVTCVVVKQAELGWTRENKVISPVDAVESGLVKIEKLKAPVPSPVEAAQTQTADEPQQPAVKSIVSRNNETATPPKAKTETRDDETPTQPTPATEKSEKSRRKKKNGAAAAAADQGTANGNVASPRVGPTKGDKNNADRVTSQSTSVHPGITQEVLDTRITTMEQRLKDHIAHEVQSLNTAVAKKVDSAISKRETDFESKFKVLLDMVSSVLNDNTQEVLNHLIQKQFKTTLIPNIRETVTRSISEQVTKSIQAEVQKSLPASVSSSLRQQDTLRALGDTVARTVNRNVEDVISHAISTQVAPNLSVLATQVVQSGEEIRRLEQAQRSDANKIEQLVNLTTRLTETVSSMAAAQNQFQAEFLKMQMASNQAQQQSHHSPPQTASQHMTGISQHHHQSSLAHQSYGSPPHQQMSLQPHHGSQVGSLVSAIGQSSYHSPPAAVNHTVSPPHSQTRPPQTSGSGSQLFPREPSAADRLVARVEAMMNEGNQETAVMEWLHGSPNEEEVFQRVLKKYDPDFLRKLPPLVLLSVGATVTTHMDAPGLREKLSWIEMVILVYHSMLPTLDSEVLQITPRILELIKGRIETIFMRISNTQAGDPSLKNLSQMNSVINRMLTQLKPRNPY